MTLHELSNEIDKIKGQVFDSKRDAKSAIRNIIRECGYAYEWRSDDRSCYTWACVDCSHDKRIQSDKLVLTVEFRCKKAGRRWEVRELDYVYHFNMNWDVGEIVAQVLDDQNRQDRAIEVRNQECFEKIKSELNPPVDSIRDLALWLKRLDSMMSYEFEKAIKKEQREL